MQRVGIYRREKTRKGWRYRRVEFGRGKKHGDITGPFFLRYTGPDGKRVWQPAKDSTVQETMEEAETVNHGLKAASRGLTVNEFDEVSNAYRVPIHSGCQDFLELKRHTGCT
jgi:hypothetical protein